jgi:hypothetical protein
MQSETHIYFYFGLIDFMKTKYPHFNQHIDQMNNEMKKIVEIGNKHGNRDEFPEFADFFFFFGIKNVRVGGKMLGSGP